MNLHTSIHRTRPITPATQHHRPHEHGLSLLETLVYIVLLSMIFLMSYECYYRTTDTVRRMTRNCDDIMEAQRAGESWRNHVRTASAPVTLGTDPSSQELFVTIPSTHGLTRYSFRDATVWIQTPTDAAPRPLVLRVLNCKWVEDVDPDSQGWRWELELKPIQNQARIRPLFTFLTIHPTHPTP